MTLCDCVVLIASVHTIRLFEDDNLLYIEVSPSIYEIRHCFLYKYSTSVVTFPSPALWASVSMPPVRLSQSMLSTRPARSAQPAVMSKTSLCGWTIERPNNALASIERNIRFCGMLAVRFRWKCKHRNCYGAKKRCPSNTLACSGSLICPTF